MSPVRRGLARRGIDVSTTPDSRLLYSPDQTQLEFAAALQWVWSRMTPICLSSVCGLALNTELSDSNFTLAMHAGGTGYHVNAIEGQMSPPSLIAL
jgi:hypothetical protein